MGGAAIEAQHAAGSCTYPISGGCPPVRQLLSRYLQVSAAEEIHSQHALLCTENHPPGPTYILVLGHSHVCEACHFRPGRRYCSDKAVARHIPASDHITRCSQHQSSRSVQPGRAQVPPLPPPLPCDFPTLYQQEKKRITLVKISLQVLRQCQPGILRREGAGQRVAPQLSGCPQQPRRQIHRCGRRVRWALSGLTWCARGA